MPIRPLLPFLPLLSVVLLAFADRPASALMITTADGVGADTFVRWREDLVESDTNYGDFTTVRTTDPQILNSAGFSNTRKTYLRFDLSAVGTDVVTEAALRLTFAGTGQGDTRDSVLRIAEREGFRVTERNFTVEEMLERAPDSEAVLTGTAAVLASVGTLIYQDREYSVGDGGVGPEAKRLRTALTRIQQGEAEDTFGWLTEI